MTKIIAGSNGIHLAVGIAENLKIPMINAFIKKFPDQELHVELATGVGNNDAIIVQPTSTPTNEHLMELLLLADAARRTGARKIIAVVPYLGYSRQNRQSHPYGPISAQLVANMIEAAGIDQLLTVDLHSLSIKDFFKIKITNVETTGLFAEILKKRSSVSIVSPDAGGLERVCNLSNVLGVNFAIINKIRKGNGSCEIAGFSGDVKGLHCILLDDIIDTGTTLCKAADMLIKEGARSVEAMATHAVLSGTAKNVLDESHISKVTVTNSIQHLNLGAKFEVIDSIPLIAKNLNTIL